MVYGLYVPVILAAFVLVVCCLPCMAILVLPLFLLVLGIPILIIALLLFPFVWYEEIFSLHT